MPTPQPVWITQPGSLGTIPEGVYYSVPVVALDPDPTIVVKYELVAGTLPKGMVCSPEGLIFGVPVATEKINGVETTVAVDVTKRFTIRAYTSDFVDGVLTVTSLVDRAFSFTVTGNYVPQFVTPAGTLGTYDEGVYISDLQINFLNPTGIVVATISGGSLPRGLTMDTAGKITGVLEGTPGTSTFTVKLANGLATALRTFSITVVSVAATVPVVTTPQGSIGAVRSDIIFSYQFTGENVDGVPFQFIATTALPPGLTLDPNTGWLYGLIPSGGIIDNVYNFSIQPVTTGAPVISGDIYDFSLEIVGTVDNTLTWLNGPDLGTIDNGATSTLFVAAVSGGGQTLTYSLDLSADNSLPQGLSLLSDGSIAGRVSFDTFALDDGYTTFDDATTTFDMSHTFTVHVTSADGAVNAYRTFTITVNRLYNRPYNNLYIEAMPGVASRDLVHSLISDSQIFPEDMLYRPLDPNFGLSTAVNYWHCYGLNPADRDNYFSALSRNHFWRNITLGEFKTARALDDAGNVLYEVVYSSVIDERAGDLISYSRLRITADITTITADDTTITVDTIDAITMSKSQTLPYYVDDYSVPPQSILQVYPNSLVDMRDRVIDSVGQISNMLPRWMLSTQEDGTVLGFTPAWVVAYTKPGQSKQIAYNISQYFDGQINEVDFKIDRYELDNALTYNWDIDDSRWIPSNEPAVTFDVVTHYQNTVVSTPATPGSGYRVGDRIRIRGSQFGWRDGLNDCVMTVNTVTPLGGIVSVFCYGFAQLVSTGDTFTGLVGTNISGSGTGATWNITVTGGVPTTFDGNKLDFTAPSDQYIGTDTDRYNKFIVYQNQTILGTLPQ